MEVKAKAKHIRMSPRKIRLVLDLIKGRDVIEARHQLQFLTKGAKRPVLKVLNSAVANAEHNFNFKKENLYIKDAVADEGATLKRWMPRAFGRAAPIRKRSAHITIILGERVESKRPEAKRKKAKIKKPDKLEVLPKGKKPAEGTPSKVGALYVEEGKSGEIFDERRKGKHRAKQHLDKVALKGKRGFVSRIFRRKAV